jgi:hypothetical protein
MFVMFIFVTEIRPGLGWASSNLFYDGAEMSQIASIYDVFIKSLRELIYDAQYKTLSQNVTDTFLS